MMDVQKAHFWIFFVNSEKTKILDQNIFLHKFCFTKGLPIILKYVLALCMVFVTPYRLFQYLHPKGIKFDFFFHKKFSRYCRNFCTKMYLLGADTQKYLYIPKYVSYCKFYLIAVSKNSKYNKSYEKVYRTPQKWLKIGMWSNKNIYQVFPIQKGTLLIFYFFPHEMPEKFPHIFLYWFLRPLLLHFHFI